MYYNTLNFAIMYNFKGDRVSLIIESENEYTQLQMYIYIIYIKDV